MNDEGKMRINVTGTRPGKPKPRTSEKEGERALPPAVKTPSRTRKILELRATARERRTAAILEKYGIPYDSTRPDVVASTLPGNENLKGYRKRKKPPPKK
jgi:hypothetical protein